MTITEGKITVGFDKKDIKAIYDVAEICEDLSNLLERTVEDTIASYITSGELYDIAHRLYELGNHLDKNSNILTFEREDE